MFIIIKNKQKGDFVMKGDKLQLFKLVVIFVAIFALLGTFAGPATAAKKPIKFNDRSWDSIQVHNRIAGFIIKHGYGFDVEYLPGETVPLLTALQRGDTDIDMESWTENSQELYDKGIREGTMLDLGPNYPDSWQGWLVPTFVIKGDKKRGIKPMAPGLKSVFDLPKYWEVFKDPENPKKGRFFNSIPGWKVTEINTTKLKGYGLDKYYTDFIPGSDAALAGSMAAAVKRGRPWVGYYWAPTWILGKLDMTALEEPPFDKKTWDTTKACAFQSVQVNILVNATLPKRAPEVVEMLKKYETTTALNNEILAFMQDTKGKAEDGALWFLKNKESLWTQWVPADVAEKVKKALK
jgi:glycine betaine/proline transport system substrate-binding protein